MPFNAAIIGCGLIAEEHLKALATIDEIVPVAYCDVDPSRAREMLARHGGRYATDAVERIFGDDSIDLVYICTHHDTHADLAIRACRAGKHVMMEKPLALTLPQCVAIGDAVEKSGVTLMTAFKLRYYPMVERARAFIENPLITIAQGMDRRWPDDYWAQDPQKGGGNLLSQGCHTMDLLYYLNRSEPVSIFAEGGSFTHPGSAVFDTMAATIRFANGRVASVALGDCGEVPYVSKFSIQLVDGLRSVHLHNRLRSGVFFDGAEQQTLVDEAEEGMLRENIALAASLVNRTPPPTGYVDGLRATTMIIRAFDAIRTGQPQTISL
jgi:predicted dehydrogenase